MSLRSDCGFILQCQKGPLKRNKIGCLGASPKRVEIEAEGIVLGQVQSCADISIFIMAEGKLGSSELNK